MPRISKNPQVRMNEILDTAESLFYSQGYDETAVSDIVKKIEVAQGTFYNYFESKEAVLEAIVNRHLSKIIFEMEAIAAAKLIPPKKIEQIIYATFNNLRNENGWMFDFLYDHKHLHIIDKLVRQGSVMFSPFLIQVIEEGIRQGFFEVNDPGVVLELMTAVIQCLCHALYQNQSAEQLALRFEIAGKMIDSALGLEKGTLHLTV
jgi:AcrR family transcriptional regulator